MRQRASGHMSQEAAIAPANIVGLSAHAIAEFKEKALNKWHG